MRTSGRRGEKVEWGFWRGEGEGKEGNWTNNKTRGEGGGTGFFHEA